MSSIQQCCNAMWTMIHEGTLQPFTTYGHNTAQATMVGNNGEMRHYNEIKYCQFCGKEIRLI
jgi:hypothetical protein